ncbi:hypothetical protein [Undibacterium sp. Di24W]|uniref:hypothetical protein n=1 Tax=Undibacterium sp. Di24W TaxID=3413033 RepID=UPI003BF333B9
MLRKFKDGLIFGAGFSVAFLVLSYLGFLLFTNMKWTNNTPVSENGEHIKVVKEIPFHELSPEEQINRASVIALAKHEKLPNGKYAAVVKEFIKKDPNTTVYYKIGDEYPRNPNAPEVDKSYAENMLIFFTGSPATMVSSFTYSGERISSLGDMPIEVLRNKSRGKSN